jgi:hypothetical protein
MSLTSSVQSNFLPSRFHGREFISSFLSNTRDMAPFERPTMLEAGNAAQV